METPDEVLIAQIAQGDEQAFLTLYDRYSQPIYNYILRLIHHPRDAEDLLQETFLAVWQSSRRFRGKSSAKTWMYRIAHNQTVSRLRQRQKLDQVASPPEELDIPDAGHQPEAALIADWQNAQLQAALEQLSSKHRAVVELTFVNGFAYKEISEIMQIPVGTVKSRMSYALKFLSAAVNLNE